MTGKCSVGAILFLCAVAVAGVGPAERAGAATLTWSGADSAVDLNWSDNLNWSPNGSPSGNAVLFTATGGSPSGITSIVNTSVAIGALTFANTVQQSLSIPSATTTLTSSGSFVFANTASNQNNSVLMSGPGAFVVSYSNANFQVGTFNAANDSESMTLSMSGLSTFTFSGSNFQVGGYGSNTGEFRDNAGTVYLASTSSITANTVYVGYSNGANPSSASYLYLSRGTNTIAANAINVALSKASGNLLFTPGAGAASAVTISGTAGATSRVPMTIGDHNGSTGTGSTGVVDFSLGQVNATISTLIDGACDNTGGGGKGTGTFILGPNPNSLVDVNTVEVGEAASGGGGQATGTLTIEGGTFRFGTFPAEIGTQNINFQGGTIASNSTTGSTMVPGFNLGVSGNTAAVTFGQVSGVGAGALTFSGTVSLLGNTTVTANVGTTLSGIISGGYALTTAGTGQISLTNNSNSYSGGTTITSGTVSLGAAGSLGGGDVTVQGGGALDASAYVGTLSIGGSLGLNSGLLAYGGPLNIGGNLGLNSGTLTGNPANAITVAGGATLGGVNYVIPGAELSSGTYALITYPASGLSGSAANLALGGPFIVNGSRQTYSFDTSTGTAVNLIVNGSAGSLQWNGGANSTWDTLTSQNWLNLSGGTLDYFYPGDNTTFTDTPGTATTVNISGTVLPGSVTMSNMNVAYTFSGAGSIIGGAALTIDGPGALTIANSNTYYGGTNLLGGQLNINNANALGTGPLNISSGSIDCPAGPITIAGNAESWTGSFTFVGSNPLNTGTGAVTLANGPTVTVNAGTLTVGGGMAGNSGLTISGTGLFLSTAANSYTGATTIGAGSTLQLGTGQAGQDGSLATSTVTNQGALIYNLAGAQTAGYAFTGAGSLTKLGAGNLSLSLASTGFTGPTSVNGGTLTLANGGQNGTILFSPITVASGAYLNLNFADALGYGAAGASVTISGVMNKINAQSETLNRPIILSGGTMTSTTGAGAPDGAWDFFGNTISTASGTTNYITGVGDFAVRTGSASFNLGANSTLTITVPVMEYTPTSSPNFNITGPGTMILAGTNTYGTNSGTATAVQVGFNSLAGNLLLAGSSNFPRTADGSFQVAYGSTLTVSNSAIAFVQSDLKLGAGTTGSSGTANQTGGVLAVTGVDTGNNNRSLVIGEYPTETSVYNLSAGSLSVPNGWTYLGYSGSGVLNISAGTASLLGIAYGQFAQGGALNLSGNGLLVIGGSGISTNNNVNATATISGGTLQTNSSWSTNLPMTFNGPATFNLSGNTVGLSGTSSGIGSLALNGPGTMTLGGSNSYSGGTTVPAGVIVRAGNNNALGIGPLYLNGGIVSANGASSYSLASPLVLSSGTLGDTVNNGALTFTAASGTLAQNTTLTVNSPVTISGGLTDGGSGFTFAKNGTGALTLAGNNTYSGSMSVNSGGLYINGTNATPSIFVAQGMTLGGSGTAAAAVVTVDGAGTPASGGILDLSQNAGGTLTFAGLTFNNHANIYLPVFTSTASLALQAGTLTVDGQRNSVQFSFSPMQTLIANGTYRLLAYTGAIGGTGPGFNSFSVPNPPPLGGRQSGGLVNNPGEIDYTVTGYTPYWNGQQPDWQSTNAWTLNPSGSLTSFEASDNDVFDDSGATGAVGTNVNIDMGNVNPISVTFNSTTASYTISGSNGIIGSAFLQINGGVLTINNSNAYTSGTIFNAGTLNLNNASAIGTGLLTIGGGTLGNTSGGPIALATNNVQAWNANFTFNGPYNLNLGTGAVTLSNNPTLTLAAGTLTVGGPISGAAQSLTIAGPGGLVLGGANSYNSGTFILGGNVTASDNNSPLGSGPVSMVPASGSATLTLTGSAATIGALTMSPTGTAATAYDSGTSAAISSVTMTPNNGTATLTFGGVATGPLTMSPNNGTATATLSGDSADGRRRDHDSDHRHRHCHAQSLRRGADHRHALQRRRGQLDDRPGQRGESLRHDLDRQREHVHDVRRQHRRP